MNLFKRILPDIVVIILFAVISFVYFFPAVTEGRVLSQHDAVAGIGAGEESKEYLERTGERTRWTNSNFWRYAYLSDGSQLQFYGYVERDGKICIIYICLLMCGMCL